MAERLMLTKWLEGVWFEGTQCFANAGACWWCGYRCSCRLPRHSRSLRCGRFSPRISRRCFWCGVERCEDRGDQREEQVGVWPGGRGFLRDETSPGSHGTAEGVPSRVGAFESKTSLHLSATV